MLWPGIEPVTMHTWPSLVGQAFVSCFDFIIVVDIDKYSLEKIELVIDISIDRLS